MTKNIVGKNRLIPSFMLTAVTQLCTSNKPISFADLATASGPQALPCCWLCLLSLLLPSSGLKGFPLPSSFSAPPSLNTQQNSVGGSWRWPMEAWPITARCLFVSSPPLPWPILPWLSLLWVELYGLWTAFCQQVCKQANYYIITCIQWTILESGENPGHKISIFPTHRHKYSNFSYKILIFLPANCMILKYV